ncbi:MAG: hypothetical protein LUF78_07585 [Clostridiales bacterium]|nr:hypothetical protein [Clostridiales bacterium]
MAKMRRSEAVKMAGFFYHFGRLVIAFWDPGDDEKAFFESFTAETEGIAAKYPEALEKELLTTYSFYLINKLRTAREAAAKAEEELYRGL